MSDLHKRLAYHANSKRFHALLSTLEELTWNGFVASEEEATLLDTLWGKVIQIDAEPTRKLNRYSSMETQTHWLKECVDGAFVGTEFLLFVGGFGMPFSKVSVTDEYSWLLALWKHRDCHDLMIVSPDHAQLLAFTDEEYDFYAYLCEPSEL